MWKGEGWPKEWNEGTIVPIVKKGEGVKVEEYRGVTLTQTAYKVYVAVLAKRLRKEVEEKGLLQPSQTGFRKGLGTVDNIYVLNYLINRQIKGERGKMAILFVDMKVAFDTMDRGVLVETMRRKGVREGLVRRCEEVLRETISRVRVGGEEGREFWTMRGVRQGCPLNPCLFMLLLADMDEELDRGGWDGLKLGRKRVRTLAYADDVAMLTEDEGILKGMMKWLEGYLEEKGLMLNVGKTKVMRCRKGGGRWKKVIWKWKGSLIEEVKEFNYLGYVMSYNGKQEKHIRERE